MNRCSFCEWILILPLPVWPLAGQFLLGPDVVVGSMTLILVARGNIAARTMSGPPFAVQLHRTTIWCGATKPAQMSFNEVKTLFHEFGHGLQHMLTTVDYGLAAGIHNIEWDAVELPSQFME